LSLSVVATQLYGDRLAVYIPAHCAADEQAVDDLLTHHGAADLITATPEGVR
jgi:hypothetical protein